MLAIDGSPKCFIASRIDNQVRLEYPSVPENIFMDRFDIQPGKFCAESLRQGIRLETEDTIHAQSVATEVFGEKSIRVNDGKPSAGIASSHANQIVLISTQS